MKKELYKKGIVVMLIRIIKGITVVNIVGVLACVIRSDWDIMRLSILITCIYVALILLDGLVKSAFIEN